MTTGPQLIYQWKQVSFDWTGSPKTQETALKDGSFTRINNVITGIKVLPGSPDRVFVTVPRWRHGVPSTLNEVVSLPGSTQEVLKPYPSWTMNEVNNCNALQYTQSMEIDPEGRMWIIDTGRINFFDANKTLHMNKCPPKLVIFDIRQNKTLLTYVFPNDHAPYNATFLNDIVVDPEKRRCFISDVGAGGAIVTYDWAKNVSNRFHDPTMTADQPGQPGLTITMFGKNYTNLTTSEDGIALTPDKKWIYYNPLSSMKMHRVPVDTLLTTRFDPKKVEFVGTKPSQSDGMTFSNESVIYYGAFTQMAIYHWKIGNNTLTANQAAFYSDPTTMQWVDTFAWDDTTGYLWFTTNRLQLYFSNTLNTSEYNFRVQRIQTNQRSYMWHSEDKDTVSIIDPFMIIAISVGGVCVCALLMFFCFRWMTADKRHARKESSYERLYG